MHSRPGAWKGVIVLVGVVHDLQLPPANSSYLISPLHSLFFIYIYLLTRERDRYVWRYSAEVVLCGPHRATLHYGMEDAASPFIRTGYRRGIGEFDHYVRRIYV
ncbi:hypothetical protein F5X99DRAFT_375260 [Biscogniauxia marginata]|nr:hypothetical protein F5X99DRAFT_375260 [Biscogniauxia marginata]